MKRFILIGFLSLVFVLVEIVNWTCLFLDNLLFPSWKKIRVVAPVFVVGMPRTGTTRLQSVLGADKIQFSSMKLWEMLFAPSVLQKKFFILVARVDRLTHGFLSRPLHKLDQYAFRQYKPAHPTSFFGMSEDDLLLIHIFSGLFLIFLFPSKKNLKAIIRFDDTPNETRNLRIIRFYKHCIMKHLYVFGEHKTYLSKSPGHTPKMNYLTRIFPDCRFICTFRKPEQVIPSAISLFVRFCEIYYTPYQVNRIVNRTFEMADYWYPHPLEIFKTLQKSRYILVNYTALTQDIRSVICNIYNHFNITLGASYDTLLTDMQAQSYISAHQYSAEKFGLTAGQIRQRYNPVYEELLKRSNDAA